MRYYPQARRQTRAVGLDNITLPGSPFFIPNLYVLLLYDDSSISR